MTNKLPYGAISSRVTGQTPVPNVESQIKSEEPTVAPLDERDVMTLQQVSEWLGISEDDLKKMARADCIPAFHPVKNCFFFSRRDLLSWLEENKRGRIKKNENNED